MNKQQEEHYERCLALGTSPKLAEMFALGAPPMSNTDREFLEGRGSSYDQFRGHHGAGDFYAKIARREGVDITGKVYLSGLAAYPGDPRAWVSGRGDVRRVCEERNWTCQGAVNISNTPVQGDTRYHVAPDLVQERALDLVEEGLANPGEDALEAAKSQLMPDRGESW